MATKRTYSYKVVVHTMNGDTFTAEDTTNVLTGAVQKFGYSAFQQFEHHDTVKIVGSGQDVTYIPFHAIAYVVVTLTSSSVEYTDDTCEVATESE